MEQYIYANVNREAYKLVSSAPDFFGNIHNAKLMRHLIIHDNHCSHGELSSWTHQSFWMVTTDMDKPGEIPRLFIQASGGDPHRDGIYVHGYMCQVGDNAIYRDRMQQLLSLSFLSLEGALKAGEAGVLPRCDLDQLPTIEGLQELPLEKETLKAILREVLQRKKVVIRLTSVGRQAMEDSRRLLLTIYNRLPYDFRASTGFVTGASVGDLNNEQNPLPGAVNLILVDGDTDFSAFHARPSQVFFDLGRQPGAPVRQESRNREAFLNFLTEGEEERRQAFFQEAQEYRQRVKPRQRMDLPDYLTVYQSFKDMEGPVTAQYIKLNAVTLLLNPTWSGQQKIAHVENLKEKLSPERLLQHFREELSDLPQLSTLGIPDRNELEQLKLDKTGSREIQDKNAGFVFYITNLLLKLYPEGTREMLLQGLCDHFLQIAADRYPWYTEEKPVAETLKQASQLRLEFPAQKPGLATDVRKTVGQLLQEKQKALIAVYQENLKTQKEWGSRQISSWNGENASLEELYGILQKNCYLWKELLKSTWNGELGKRIVFTYSGRNPETGADFQRLQEEIRVSVEYYTAQGGALTEPQTELLNRRQQWCAEACALDRTDCGSLEELLKLYTRMDRGAYSSDFARMLKGRWAGQLAEGRVSCPEVFRLISPLTSAGENIQSRPGLRYALSLCPALLRVPGGLPEEELRKQLESLEKLEKQELLSGPVFVEDWNVKGSAGAFGKVLQAIRTYGGNSPKLTIPEESIRIWAAESYRDNMDLAVLLADQSRQLRPSMVARLAASGTPVSAETIQRLYAGGCSLQLLREGAGEKTGDAWKQAFHQVFPEMPELPDLLPLQEKRSSEGWLVAEGILTGLAGLLPAAVLFLQPLSLINAGVTAISLSTLLLILEISSFAVYRRTRKKWMRLLGAALIPGVLASIAALVLACMQTFF